MPRPFWLKTTGSTALGCEILTWNPWFLVSRSSGRLGGFQCHRITLLPQEDGQISQVYSRIDANQRTAPVPPGRLSDRSNAPSKNYDLAALLVSLRVFRFTCCMPRPALVSCHDNEDVVLFPSLADPRCTCLCLFTL